MEGYPEPWFIPRAKTILQRLVNQDGFYVVISSAWRHYLTMDQPAKWFGIPQEKILGKTPDLWGKVRGGEIEHWLSNAVFEEKIDPKPMLTILDDESDMLDWQKPYFVQTEWSIPEDPEAAGLNWEHYQKIMRIIYKHENGYIQMRDLP